MEEKFIMNSRLLEYIMENIKTMGKCDIEEKINSFPYTRSASNFFQKLKYNYDIEFDEKLISEKLLDLMVNEVIKNLPK